MPLFQICHPRVHTPELASSGENHIRTSSTNLWAHIQDRIISYVGCMRLGCIRARANYDSMRNPSNIQALVVSDSNADFLIDKIYHNHRLSLEELRLVDAIPFEDLSNHSLEFVQMLSKRVQHHSRSLYEKNIQSGGKNNIDAEMAEYNALLISLGKIQCSFIERHIQTNI